MGAELPQLQYSRSFFFILVKIPTRYLQAKSRHWDVRNIPTLLSSWNPLLEEGDFLGIHWGCGNRRGPLKADPREQGAQSSRYFLGKGVLLYSHSLHSSRLCLTDPVITDLLFFFSYSHLSSVTFSFLDTESDGSIHSCQEELYTSLWLVRVATAFPLLGAGPERTVELKMRFLGSSNNFYSKSKHRWKE